MTFGLPVRVHTAKGTSFGSAGSDDLQAREISKLYFEGTFSYMTDF